MNKKVFNIDDEGVDSNYIRFCDAPDSGINQKKDLLRATAVFTVLERSVSNAYSLWQKAGGTGKRPDQPSTSWENWASLNKPSGEEVAKFMTEVIWPDALTDKSQADQPLRSVVEHFDPATCNPKALELAYNWGKSMRENYDHDEIFEKNINWLEAQFDSEYKTSLDQFVIDSERADVERVMGNLLEALNPGDDETIYDPFCGSGRLLKIIANRERNFALEASIGIKGGILIESLHHIYGYENDLTSFLICTARMLLQGGSNPPNLELGSPISNRNGKENTALHDVILTAIPFGKMLDDHPKGYPVRSKQIDNLALQHVLGSLNPGGRAAVLVPESLLFWRGSDKKLRQFMLENYSVDAVISLPEYQSSLLGKTKMSVLLIRRDKPRRHIWFVNEEDYDNDDNLQARDHPGVGALGWALMARMGAGDKEKIHDWITASSQILESEDPAESMLLASKERIEVTKHLTLSRDALALIVPIKLKSLRNFLPLVKYFLKNNSGDETQKIPIGADHEERNFLLQRLAPIDTLVARGTELIAKNSGEADLEEFLEVITQNYPETEIQPLEDLAKVFRGENVKREWIARNKESPGNRSWHSLPEYIRVSDVPKDSGGDTGIHPIFSTGVRLEADALQELPENCRVHESDILVTMDGSVGRVARFKSDLLNLDVASSGHFAPEGLPIIPSYGIAVIQTIESDLALLIGQLLRTEPYRNWMQGHARGNITRHLNLRDLRKIPIPKIADRSLLITIIEHFQGGGSVETFAQWLEYRADKPILKLLLDTREVKDFASANKNDLASEKGRNLLQNAIETISTDIADIDKSDTDAFMNWMREFAENGKTLLQIMLIESKLGKISALQGWRLENIGARGRFFKAYVKLRNSTALESKKNKAKNQIQKYLLSRAESMFNNFLYLWQSEYNDLLDDIRIDAAISPSIILSSNLEKSGRISVKVKNRSALPLRELQYSINAYDDEKENDWIENAIWVGAESENEIGFPIGPKSLGSHTFMLSWQAIRLDGKKTSGRVELAIEVVDGQDLILEEPLGTSPYVFRRVIEGELDDMFFGRQEDIDKISQTLNQAHGATVLLLEGRRRIGKTSLLKHFIVNHLPVIWIPVYLNFQDFTGAEGVDGEASPNGVPTREIFYEMTKGVLIAAASHAPDLEVPGVGILADTQNLMPRSKFLDRLSKEFDGGRYFEKFQDYLNLVREGISPKQVLLVMDEFGVVHDGIKSGVTSHQVPQNIRHILQTYNDIAAIIAAPLAVTRMRENYWDVLFGIGDILSLSSLDESSARELVTTPVHGRLVYAPQAIDLIVEVSACQPEIIQSLCDRLFRRCADTGARLVTLDMVEEIVDQSSKTTEYFKAMWDDVKDDRTRCLAFVVNRRKYTSEPATFEAIYTEVEKEGILYSGAEGLEQDLQDLVDLEILASVPKRKQKCYEIRIPLLSRWLNATKDFSRYKLAATEN